jgi:hypothetical protein
MINTVQLAPRKNLIHYNGNCHYELLTIKICYYSMFTLEQQIFIVQCFFTNGERLGPIRHLEFLRNFN